MRYLAIVVAVGVLGMPAWAAYTNNIMLTGYWPPTNEMLRPFSTNPELNPDGWIGENWNDKGYNVYSFFPEVEVGEKGVGDFEVDYQDTSADWWRITEEIRPVAIITFSWTSGKSQWDYKDWEIEMRNRNRTSWTDDYMEPYKPDVVPPDPDYPANQTRNTSLPMHAIWHGVNDADVGVNAYPDYGTGGTFLSEYIGYHGLWYHALHEDPSDPYWNVAAGHIHVGSAVTVEEAYAATLVTLDILIDYVDEVVPEPTTAVLLLTGVPLLRRR